MTHALASSPGLQQIDLQNISRRLPNYQKHFLRNKRFKTSCIPLFLLKDWPVCCAYTSDKCSYLYLSTNIRASKNISRTIFHGLTPLKEQKNPETGLDFVRVRHIYRIFI